MAGDWIKMRADLFTHPKVVRISSALKTDTLRTVGGLMSVWCLFDAHSEDGQLSGYNLDVLDSHIRWPGFAAAMVAVGWLGVDANDALVLPRFDTHNGQSAKRRAQDAIRKREVRKMSAFEADETRTREEKRREEKPPKSPRGENPRFDRFWKAYPNKTGKDAARKAFEKRKPDDELTALMVMTVEAQRFSPQWQKDGGQYIPNPATWLNQGRWQDEISAVPSGGNNALAGAI